MATAESRKWHRTRPVFMVAFNAVIVLWAAFIGSPLLAAFGAFWAGVWFEMGDSNKTIQIYQRIVDDQNRYIKGAMMRAHKGNKGGDDE